MANPLIQNQAVPLVQARLQPYIQLHASYQGYDGTGPLPSASQLQLVGAFTKFNFKSQRTGGSWRQFGPNEFGRIAETYPNLTKFDLSFSRVLLNSSDVLEELGWIGPSVRIQNAPIFFICILMSPGNVPNKAWGIDGSWLLETNAKFDLTTDTADMKIVQEIPIHVREVFSI
jgi:hypothetical protein